jgi:hypothetical protein
MRSIQVDLSLLEKGIDPNAKTTDYKRNFWTKVKDTLGGGIKNWKNPPPRTFSEVAQLTGNTLLTEGPKTTEPPIFELQQRLLLVESEVTQLKQSLGEGPGVKEPLSRSSKVLDFEPRQDHHIPRGMVVKNQQTINNLIHELNGHILNADPRDRKLIEIQRNALTEVKEFLDKNPDLSSNPKKAEAFSKVLSEQIDKANEMRIKEHQGANIPDALSNRVEEKLREMRDDITTSKEQVHVRPKK